MRLIELCITQWTLLAGQEYRDVADRETGRWKVCLDTNQVASPKTLHCTTHSVHPTPYTLHPSTERWKVCLDTNKVASPNPASCLCNQRSSIFSSLLLPA